MNKILIVFAFAGLLVSCKKNKDQDEFDRKAMLSNMASAVIKPAYNDLASALANLDASAQSFVASPDHTNLTVLRTAYENAYRIFQHCKMYNFGPMLDYGLKASLNTYPTDTTQIQNNINAGTYTLSSLENIDAIGFPALDFLLYHHGDNIVIDHFSTHPNSANRKVYLTDLTSKMKTEFDLVISGWNSYESTFINSDGNDIGSSTSMLFNEFVKDIELLKNAKIGVPAGQLSGGMPLPEQCEAYYSGISVDLAIENITGLKNCFLGATGKGFDDYVADVQDEVTTPNLEDEINDQFERCKTAVSAIGNPLSDQVISNPSAVNEAYLQIKKLVTFCKTDMSSTLGLLITFQDNDGD